MTIRRIFLAVLGSLLCLFLLGGCGQGKYVPKANEEIYGTWINEKTGAKIVLSPDGSFGDYSLSSATTPHRGGKYKISRKWTDSEGSVYYEVFSTFTFDKAKWDIGTTLRNLEKVSKPGTVLEWNWVYATSDVPKAIDPKGNNYLIYYRAKE
jgi:hypothetical protein